MKLHEVANNTKVLDDHGKPRIVYHGSDKQFDQFDKDLAGEGASDGILQYGHGIYFTSNQELANDYGKFVKQAYLTITTPIRMDQDIPDKVTQYALNKFPKLQERDDYEVKRAIGTVHRFLAFLQNAGYDTSEVLTELGYDGIIEIHPYANTYVVFNADQINIVE